MKKEKILTWIQESIKSLENERDYNEDEYKKGENVVWTAKDEGNMFEPMCNYWGYQSLIWQLQNIERLINKGEFDE